MLGVKLPVVKLPLAMTQPPGSRLAPRPRLVNTLAVKGITRQIRGLTNIGYLCETAHNRRKGYARLSITVLDKIGAGVLAFDQLIRRHRGTPAPDDGVAGEDGNRSAHRRQQLTDSRTIRGEPISV